MKGLLALAVVLFICGTVLVAVALRGGGGEGSLADRINAACAPNPVSDWTVGGEYVPMPDGVVQVTCLRRDGSLYRVAVQR